MTENIFVVAGNHREFSTYPQPDRMNYIYVSSIMSILGTRKPKVLLVGTYYRRIDWHNIELELKIREAQIINE